VRIEFDGALYHLTPGGNERKAFFSKTTWIEGCYCKPADEGDGGTATIKI
jgi:hypothetical protein